MEEAERKYHSDIGVATPFPALSSTISTHVSYLDTTGRPAVLMTYKDLADKHTAMIYVRRAASDGIF